MGKNITGRTQLCGVIGDPISHTMSPAMHNAAFEHMGLDFCYVPFLVRKEELPQAVAGMRAFNMRGLNVTMPHKVAIISLLDEIDDLARKIGAVNTVVNNDGVLRGYNFDAAGFIKALTENGVEPEGKMVTIMGAGGAGRSVAFALAERGVRMVVLNRRQELDWAEGLASNLTENYHYEVKALELTDSNLAGVLKETDILVNTTSVGMTPDINETPVPAGHLKSSLVVFDAVYHPVKTRLLREAEQAGARVISGLEMLVWQGTLGFELWTGVEAPAELMREEVIRQLAGDENSKSP